jgi:hypothetical protein
MPAEPTVEAPVGRLGFSPVAAASTLGSVAAPIALALTGMLYLCGWSYRTSYLAQFGRDSEISEPSLQATLATGFVPLVVGTIAAALLAGGFWWMLKDISRREKGAGWLKLTRMVNRWGIVFNIVFVVLTYSLISGAVFGNLQSDLLKRGVLGGCEQGCFVYRARRMNLLGRIVVQDEHLTALYTSGGLLIFPTDEIHLVRRYRAGK